MNRHPLLQISFPDKKKSRNHLKDDQQKIGVYLVTIISFLLLLPFTISAQSTGTLLRQTFPSTEKLIHHLKQPVFKGRPYFLELFVDIPDDELESVSIFFKTDSALDFEEVPLELIRGRYQFKFDPKTEPGEFYSYFFVVTTKDFSLYAVPLDDKGKISPNTIFPVDPIKYYESLGY